MSAHPLVPFALRLRGPLIVLVCRHSGGREKENNMSIIRRSAAVTALVVAAGLGLADAARAEAPPERDQVYATVAGDTISGYVDWSSYRKGTGRVTVYNQMNDGLCVSAQQRVMRNGAWSAWRDIVVGCFQSSYSFNVSVADTGNNVQYWQFRVRDANIVWAYDTNSPGGA
jgi:hypothetical protein